MALPTKAEAAKALADRLDELPDTEHVTTAAEQGLQMVATYLGSRAESVPDVILALATVEAGAAVYYRRTAQNGITTFGTGEVVPMRIAKDPMSSVYPILNPYATPGISR